MDNREGRIGRIGFKNLQLDAETTPSRRKGTPAPKDTFGFREERGKLLN